MNMSTDQNATPSMPATQKARPPSVAWTKPITSVPLMVARDNREKPVHEAALVAVGKREVGEDLVERLGAALEKEEHGVEQDEEAEQEMHRPAGQRREAVEEEPAGALDHLAERRDDRLPVGLEVREKRQALDQTLLQQRRLGSVLLDPRHRDLADLEGVGGDETEKRSQRQADRQRGERAGSAPRRGSCCRGIRRSSQE